MNFKAKQFTSCNRQLRWNEMRLKQIQQEPESAQYGARTTRLARWRELVVVAQRDLELPPSAPEKLMLLDIAFDFVSAYFCMCECV